MKTVIVFLTAFLFGMMLCGCGDSDRTKELKEGFEKKARDLKVEVEKKASAAKEDAQSFMKKEVEKRTKGYNKGPEDEEKEEEK